MTDTDDTARSRKELPIGRCLKEDSVWRVERTAIERKAIEGATE